jgi:hypothetical protein
MNGIRVAIRRASQKKVESLARLGSVQEKAEILELKKQTKRKLRAMPS